MNHDQLGLIDITVSKTGAVNADAIAINIGTQSMDGKNFFQQNSKDLFTHLSNAGLNVADMKVETSSQTAKNDFDMNGQNQKGNSQEKQFGSESNQRRQDSQRREDLWKLLNKEAA
jgi:flagellar hook-length control protein FliK